MKPSKLLLATTNAKKLTEMRRLLLPLGIELVDFDLATSPEIEETGQTFAENAALKAVGQAKHFNVFAVGEDSGLVVPALDGQPGIYSARYAGRKSNDSKTNDEANNEKLLDRMASIPAEQRSAYYVSSIALASPKGEVLLAVEDRCWGTILTERKGVGGFGYDPLFLVREYHQTFAELSPAVKSAISHRARSLRKFIQQLQWL